MEKNDFEIQFYKKSIKIVRPFRERDNRKAVFTLLGTLLPFFFLVATSIFLYSFSKWSALGASLVAAIFYVRMFAIMHDCAHNSFFTSQKYNLILGHFISVFFYTPFEMWQEGHNKHHVNSGNLDERDNNPDIWTLTVKEYLTSPLKTKLAYKAFRNPILYLTIVPITLFFIIFRIPYGFFSNRIKINIILLDLLIIAVYFIAIQQGVLLQFMWIHLPFCLFGFTMGAWMFYIQHQFEDTYYADGKDFIFEKASLVGSSFYKLPKLLNWMTGNVAYHHIHHLNPAVPMYNLVEAHQEIAKVYDVPSLSWIDGFRVFTYKLWDEEKEKMVPYPK